MQGSKEWMVRSNLERARRIGDRRVQQRRLVSAPLALRVPRSCIPGGRNHGLIVLDRLAADLDPMSQRPARSLMPSVAARRAGPSAGIPMDRIEDRRLCHAPGSNRADPPRFPVARPSTAIRALAPRCGRASKTAPRAERSASSSAPSTTLLDLLLARRIAHDHPRQRPYFHGFAVITRRLQPGIFVVDVQMIVRRLGTRVLRIRFALRRMLCRHRRPNTRTRSG